jgi:hypothetical protein
LLSNSPRTVGADIKVNTDIKVDTDVNAHPHIRASPPNFFFCHSERSEEPAVRWHRQYRRHNPTAGATVEERRFSAA